MIRLAAALVVIFCLCMSAQAQDALVVQTCGTLPQAYAVGSTRQPTVDANGRLCTTDVTTPGYVSGRFYPVGNALTINNTVVPTLDTVVFVYPFTVYDEAFPATSLNTVSVTGAANCVVKMAVWGHSVTTKRPTGVPVTGSNTGQICSGTPQTATVAISYTFLPGTVYWAGLAVSTGASQFHAFRIDINLPGIGMYGQIGRSLVSTTATNALSAPYTFATDIMALDLTSATFTEPISNGVPVLILGRQ